MTEPLAAKRIWFDPRTQEIWTTLDPDADNSGLIEYVPLDTPANGEPARIWCANYSGHTDSGFWHNEPITPNRPENQGAEYIALSAIASALKAARVAGMREAAGIADHFRDMCGECEWPEEAVRVGSNVADDIGRAILARAAELEGGE